MRPTLASLLGEGLRREGITVYLHTDVKAQDVGVASIN